MQGTNIISTYWLQPRSSELNEQDLNYYTNQIQIQKHQYMEYRTNKWELERDKPRMKLVATDSLTCRSATKNEQLPIWRPHLVRVTTLGIVHGQSVITVIVVHQSPFVLKKLIRHRYAHSLRASKTSPVHVECILPHRHGRMRRIRQFIQRNSKLLDSKYHS